MTTPDVDRLDRVRREMVAARLDALICRLPENVVYLTDYWPHHAFSVAVFTKDGKSILFVPEVEVDYADPAWTRVSTFGWGLLKDGDLYANYRRLLSQAKQELGLQSSEDRHRAELSKSWGRVIGRPSRLFPRSHGR